MVSEKEEAAAGECMDVIQDLIHMVESVKNLGEYQKTHKTESYTLLRRLKLLLPLLEEIRDLNPPFPEESLPCLHKLKKAFQTAKKLLKISHGGSKIYLALESESVMVRFHSVYDKLGHALEEMPYNVIGISDEVKEQVELMRNQLKRGKLRHDSQDLELTMDMMVVLSAENDRNTDSASIERLANKLCLHTVEELKTETIAVKKLVKERRGNNAEATQQIVDLLNKLKVFVGVEESNPFDDPLPKPSLDKPTSLSIPHEFLCPITLEIMRDPVIVATGQTYERESIQQWLDSDHQTCPKTGQLLSHMSLAPNFALRNLIHQWCEANNFELRKKKAANCGNQDNDEKMMSLVSDLSSSQLEVQRKAVTEIRMLSKECPENRVMVAQCGGIPPLVQLLSYPDSKIQEHAVTAILNLSIDESNKKLISKENPIPAIIEVLQNGTVGAKENSAATLFSLSMLDENKVSIGLENGIPPLVELLKEGTVRGKKDAVTALFNITLNNSNKSRAVEAGIVTPLVQIINDKNHEMVDETLSILLLLATHHEGRLELGQLPFIETIVNLIKEGSPKNKECATAVLLELSSNNTNLLLAALQYGVYDSLVQIANEGTDRGQRKANALLQLMSKSEQLFC